MLNPCAPILLGGGRGAPNEVCDVTHRVQDAQKHSDASHPLMESDRIIERNDVVQRCGPAQIITGNQIVYVTKVAELALIKLGTANSSPA